MTPRGQSSLPKWSHRAVLAPCGRLKSSILEHPQPPECASEQHFGVKCLSKNRREFRPCKMCDFQDSRPQSTRQSKCGLNKIGEHSVTADHLILRMIGPQMATRQTSDNSKLAIIPFRFRPCRFMEQLRASRHSEGSAAWAQPVINIEIE